MKKVRSKLRPTEIGVIKTFSLSPDDEIGAIAVECTGATYYYDSLAELCEKWEDYEEPEAFGWCIDEYNDPEEIGFGFPLEEIERLKEIGLWFKTKEEAEKAVEKLKIYNKLKQNGFVLSGWYYSTEGQLVILADNHEFSETEPDDLTELFGDKIC